ncbi:hypothetical protein BU24DRAFT_357926 [Aaosphaeria arxii CBS 175.79]|uniref:Uncharacterized protein n=1 Tax=Aaosphaeria arxii CBS 175.79 TaxID=1450172 RepID=A0A6A5X9W5_9PLEO|nr:uncharacterized protein BU24DRAFT_357926 [Aaosphaeria arxii CBS 175.79]KAF2009710.1 hypothetical protein BU24DRAFT_357926 [Aaosphaeria arxii CBS 175.79]
MTDKVTKPRKRIKKEANPSNSADASSASSNNNTSGVVTGRKDSANDSLSSTIPQHVAREQVQLSASTRRSSTSSVVREDPATSISHHQQLVLSPKLEPVIKRESSPTVISSPLHDAVVATQLHSNPPLLYQPSQADIYDQAFVAHFVALNKGVRTSTPDIPWLTHLPGAYADIKQPALKLSIRATSMAFYAKVRKDIPILVESYRWYNMSLHAQRRSLARFDSTTVPTDEDVLVPTILGLYEVYAGTTPTSVFQHLTAATKILEIRGPHNCSSGAAFPLFKGIRVSDAHKAAVLNQPSVFSTPEWMSLPFLLEPKNAHQALVDVLLLIPACIALCRRKCSLGSFFSGKLPLNIDLGPIRGRARELLLQLDHWSMKHPELCTAKPSEQITPLTKRGHTGKASPLSRPSPHPVLSDTFLALTASTYQATRLILMLLLQKVDETVGSTGSDTRTASSEALSSCSLLDDVKSCAESILEISEFFEKTHPVGFDFMRSVFPLVVVGILGPQEEYKTTARQTLDRWGEMRGVGGLCGAWIDI